MICLVCTNDIFFLVSLVLDCFLSLDLLAFILCNLSRLSIEMLPLYLLAIAMMKDLYEDTITHFFTKIYIRKKRAVRTEAASGSG